MRRRGISQRQLAMRSGVNHSTISRLLRGDRSPSLRTATLLARALHSPSSDPAPGDHGRNSRSAPARVEDALRTDDSLTAAEVRRVMAYYLGIRRSTAP
jgi:transcriptional regulator with XRE-family HTH domain